MTEQELEAMDLYIIRRKDGLEDALAVGDVEDVGLAEAWLEAAEAWQTSLWSLYSLVEEGVRSDG